MSEFDPDKHEFGMAYRGDFGNIAYPIAGVDCDHGYPFVVCPYDNDSGYMFGQTLIRSPEHDLIPKAKADKIAEMLHKCLDNYLGIPGEIINKSRQALEEYEEAK